LISVAILIQEFSMPTRRELLKASAQIGAAVAIAPSPLFAQTPGPGALDVNDVQSQLNATRVHEIKVPRSVVDIQNALRDAKRQSRPISMAGGRHAMGGQQFGTDAVFLDTTHFNQVVSFDKSAGRVTVEAGIEWPELIDYLQAQQAGQNEAWTIREKQTGVDRVTLGGSLASNVHGRGLVFPPIVSDVESFTLIGADGELKQCSRTENRELFSLAIGGYGLFGIIAHVTLRLVKRTKVQRVVEIIPVKDLIDWVGKRVADGFFYGDCQYSTDLDGEPDAHPGVFACYRPVGTNTPIPQEQKQLSAEDWIAFYKLARTDKKKAFETYRKYYQSTNGQVYWSDTHLLAGSFDAYRNAVSKETGTEMITEVYVTKDNFVPFMAKVRQDFIDHTVDMTYGTIRFIEQDNETFLPWAKVPSVCTVCNLHVLHTQQGKQKAIDDFRRIIDRAIEFGGRYYLTYHRWATRKQVETCYPQFVDFLRLKKKYDPQECFQSDWYRHYKTMFADKI
jgi:FAD/FMN-containing dehydrogenase